MKKKLLFALLSLLLLPLGVMAQDVTVKTTNGNLVPAVKGTGANDTFYGHNGYALWKHNQLNLTMTTADSDGSQLSTTSGQFMNPANNIFKSNGDALQLGRGTSQDCYVAFTLPKGYRFTGYTIVFNRKTNAPYGWNANGNNGAAGGNGNASFGEAVPSSNWGWYSTDTHETNIGYSTSGRSYTITRTSQTDTDMDNTLYFKLTNNDNDRAFITLESVKFYFTAEADYTPLVPAGDFACKRAVDIPFSTSTIDIGSVESRNYAGSNRVSYSYANVKDLMGKMTLFEEEAVEDGTNYDGTTGKVVDYDGDGTITSHDATYFQLGRPGNTEQIYYIETPTYIEQVNSPGKKNPIGYRIVGAKINYSFGTHKDGYTITTTETRPVTKEYPTFTISGTVDIWGTHSGLFDATVWNDSPTTSSFYMTATGSVSSTSSDAATWFRDINGYIRLVSDPSKYLKNNSNNNGFSVVASNQSPPKYNVDGVTKQISLQANSSMILSFQTSSARAWEGYTPRVEHITGVTGFSLGVSDLKPAVNFNETGNTITNTTETNLLEVPAFEPSTFTVRLYDKTGTTVIDEKEVKSGTPDGYLQLNGMNNDAVKIGVIGVGLVNGTITVQALDPYINRMNIVCQEAELQNGEGQDGLYHPTGNGGKLTQTFNASDFSVSGQAFHFYVPSSFEDDCLFTFEGLFSDYGDNTYWERSTSKNNARYSFVKSPYWTSNANLYANSYDPDADYEDKIITYVKGNTAFRFNNADVVGTTGNSTLEEYPFTLARYGENNFSQLTYTNTQLNATTPVQKTAYLFTCDETRYNISKATATQHRTYAFYKMDITAETEDYTPVLAWTPIYESTSYQNGSTEMVDGQWGLKLTTTEAGTGTNDYGYLTVSQIINEINDAVGKTGKPARADQILYIDGSELLSIVENEEKTESTTTPGTFVTNRHGLGELTNILGANALLYIPAGSSAPEGINNVAEKTAGDFRAINDIVLTDKKPFFAPFNIQVGAERFATYTRQITVQDNGQVVNATVMLPFTLKLENGLHTNPDGKCSFTVNELASRAINPKDGSDYLDTGEGTANFTPLNAEDTEANKPYMVNVQTLAEDAAQNNTISFVATQKGSLVVATTHGAKDETNRTGELIEGNVTSGVTFNNATSTFTNYGTYSGARFPNASDKDRNIFYFAGNEYVTMKELHSSRPYLYVYPFRGIYHYTSGNGSRDFNLKRFDISYDEPSLGEGTGIDDNWKAKADLMIRSDKGCLTITATKAQEVAIFSANGTCVAKASMQGSDTQTINLPSGVYVVNNVKIAVK